MLDALLEALCLCESTRAKVVCHEKTAHQDADQEDHQGQEQQHVVTAVELLLGVGCGDRGTKWRVRSGMVFSCQRPGRCCHLPGAAQRTPW